MTKINRITIHGFKSFMHKTEIPLSNKFNCILGPNGSGKSNIGDAICFVLGRISAKSMRAEKAANLIFNGGKKKKAANSAYVEISFCNKSKVFPIDDDEVVINRTITKKGSSVYRINGKKMTRTELLDLLSSSRINPEGYNIILQGDITKFVDQSPLERRKIIEEISDVAIYEERKHKALLELTKVENQLNDASIILKERKVYLKELKKDRDQALKFKGLKDQIDSNKATYLNLQITEKNNFKDKFDQEIAKFQNKISQSEEKVAKLKDLVENNRNQIKEINKEIEQKGEKEQLKVHREIEDLKVSLAQDKTRISTLKDEINKIQLRKDQFAEEIKELEEKSTIHFKRKKEVERQILDNDKELEQIEKNISLFKKKHKIESSQEIEQEIDDKDKQIDEKQEEVQKIRQQQQELLREKDRIEYQLETIDDKIKKVKAIKEESKEQLKDLQKKKSDFKDATLRLNKCLDQDSSFASQLSNAKNKLKDLQDKEAKLNAQARSIQATLSSNRAVNNILENKKKFNGVFGTIAELGQVKKKYAQALGASAGAKMQNLIVENDKVAADCIKYLKSNKLGSASFIPLNKIKYREINNDDKRFLRLPGVHDFALNLVTFKSDYKKAFSYVFGNTLIVDDIDTTRKVGIGKIKMTTLDGNIAEASGVMRGGFSARPLASFREKDSLEELEKLESEVMEQQAVISNVEHKRGSNETEINSLRKLRSELEAEIIKLERILHLDGSDLDANSDLKKELNSQLKDVDSELSLIQREINLVNRSLADLKSKKQILKSQINELREPRLLAQLSAFEESKQNVKDNVVKLKAEFNSLKMQVEQMFTPEQEKIKEIIKQHDKEFREFNSEIQNLNVRIKNNEKILSGKEKDSKEFYSKYHGLFNKREKLSAEMTKYENDIENHREKVRGFEREVNLVSLKNAEVKAKLAALTEEFEKYKDAEIIKGKSLEELKHEINKFEIMLTQMSAVNMKALEIYEEVEKEYSKLVEKKDSLDKEKTEVLSLMNEIETKKKDHFMKTFNQANENFQRIFANLFKKGKAYLQLNNPNNPFDDGLSIKVKLIGNRFMDIKSLSGGEKTLTALSFIFAIQEYQPATFYILDEIDAALDKHNSEMLSKLIRSYSDRAQYIMISHNDSMISEADVLFGVSMNEDCISKITSLKI